MKNKNFITTTDKETSEMLKAKGFQLIQDEGNKWTFLNDATMKFDRDVKIQRTNILNL